MTLLSRQISTNTQETVKPHGSHVAAKPKVRNHLQPKPSKCPKRVRIGESKIPNAGMGLFLLEDAKKGDFVARYSGEVIDKLTNEASKSNYRVKISNNMYLDAARAHHFEGRYINDGVRAGKAANVRLAAGYRTNECSITGFRWIRIFATRNIKAGEELYLDYGDDYWSNAMQAVSPPTSSRTTKQLTTPTPSTTTTTALSPIRRVLTTPQRAPPPTGILLIQPPSPWSPATAPPRILGHHNTHTQHTHNILNDTHTHTHTPIH